MIQHLWFLMGFILALNYKVFGEKMLLELLMKDLYK